MNLRALLALTVQAAGLCDRSWAFVRWLLRDARDLSWTGTFLEMSSPSLGDTGAWAAAEELT